MFRSELSRPDAIRADDHCYETLSIRSIIIASYNSRTVGGGSVAHRVRLDFRGKGSLISFREGQGASGASMFNKVEARIENVHLYKYVAHSAGRAMVKAAATRLSMAIRAHHGRQWGSATQATTKLPI